MLRSATARHRATADEAALDEVGVPATLTELIGYQLRIAQEESFQAIRRDLGNSDLKPGWYSILTILSTYPGLTPSELSKLCGRDRSTLTSTLKKFDAQGFIVSRRDSDDQRSYSVRLTAKGEAMLKRMQAVSRVHDARLDAIVGKDKPMLLKLLRRIADGLSAAAPPQGGGRSGGRARRTR